jgi:hypothetical protein
MEAPGLGGRAQGDRDANNNSVAPRARPDLDFLRRYANAIAKGDDQHARVLRALLDLALKGRLAR